MALRIHLPQLRHGAIGELEGKQQALVVAEPADAVLEASDLVLEGLPIAVLADGEVWSQLSERPCVGRHPVPHVARQGLEQRDRIVRQTSESGRSVVCGDQSTTLADGRRDGPQSANSRSGLVVLGGDAAVVGVSGQPRVVPIGVRAQVRLDRDDDMPVRGDLETNAEQEVVACVVVSLYGLAATQARDDRVVRQVLDADGDTRSAGASGPG